MTRGELKDDKTIDDPYSLDVILDDLFHGCAFAAFVEQAIIDRGTPDVERTRQRAYRFYDEALQQSNPHVSK